MKNTTVTLRPRLKGAADFVRKGNKAADIGTDHGYLAAYLVTEGICPFVTAADIGEGPLNNARETLRELGIEKEVKLVLSDGLKNIEPLSAEDIVIAGMGGTLIAGILSRCSWIKNNGIRLILQPMSHAEDVREYLYTNGFSVIEEKCVCDTGRDYCIICAEYTGENTENIAGLKYIGKLLECKNDVSQRIISRTKGHLERRLEALKEAGRNFEEQAEITDSLEFFYEKNL